jgi:hypothetical protein
MGRIVMKVGGIVISNLLPGLERAVFVLEGAVKVLEPVIDGVGLLLEGVDAVAESLPNLDDAATDLFITDMPKFTANTADATEAVDDWGEALKRAAEEARQAKRAAAELAQIEEDAGKQQFNNQAARVQRIDLALKERDAIAEVVSGSVDNAEAVERLIEVYGDEEAAIEALTKSVGVLDSGRAAAQGALQVAGEEAIADTFREQRDELTGLVNTTDDLITALHLEIDARVGVSETIKDINKQNKEAKKARKERIKDLREFNDALPKTASMVQALGAVITDQIYTPADAWGTENPGGLVGLWIAGPDPDPEAFVAAGNAIMSLGETITSQLFEPADAWKTENPGGILGILIGGEDTPFVLESVDNGLQSIAFSASQVGDAFGSMAGGIIAAGHATGAFNDDLSQAIPIASNFGSALAQASNVGEQYDAAISAGKAATAAFVEDTTAQAALMALFEGAEAARWFATPGGQPLGVAHSIAAGLYATAAAFSINGSRGRGRRAGGGEAETSSEPPDFTGTAFDQSGTTAQAPTGGTTIIVQYQSPNSREGFEFLTGTLNDGSRMGTGLQLDQSLIRGAA